MMKRRAIRAGGVLIAVCGVLLLSACWRSYRIPTGAIEEEYSPHALQGRITAVQNEQITVEADGGGMTSIALTPETRLLKARDGMVLRPELTAGQKVRVWFGTPGQPAGDGPHAAAVIMLASLDPKDDWPAP